MSVWGSLGQRELPLWTPSSLSWESLFPLLVTPTPSPPALRHTHAVVTSCPHWAAASTDPPTVPGSAGSCKPAGTPPQPLCPCRPASFSPYPLLSASPGARWLPPPELGWDGTPGTHGSPDRAWGHCRLGCGRPRSTQTPQAPGSLAAPIGVTLQHLCARVTHICSVQAGELSRPPGNSGGRWSGSPLYLGIPMCRGWGAQCWRHELA